MSETVNQGNTATNAEQETRTFTQDELNAIVNDRLGREKAKYSDYEAVKEKAAKYEELEEAKKSELQKANEKVTALQDELNTIKKQNEIRDIRAEVAKTMNIPADLLTAETKEACEAQAQAIQAFASSQAGYPQLKDAGEVQKVSDGSTRQQFADWLNSNY